MTNPTARVVRTSDFIMSVVEHCRVEPEVVQWAHQVESTQGTCALQTWKKGRNGSLNDAHNTFYLLLYGDRHMVKDHSDSERGNPPSPHGLLVPISGKGSFICFIPQTG